MSDQDVIDRNAQVDFFGFGGAERFNLTDEYWVEIKVMNEGDRRKYQNKTTKDMKVSSSGDASFSIDAGGDRMALLEIALKDWNLVDGSGNEVPFNRPNLQRFLDTTNPKWVDAIDDQVKIVNPWLSSESSIEEMQKEIDRLEDRIAATRAADEGKEK